jgi:D-serine deaminase-like pyridoxal phosphate-dependent protein
MLYPTETGWAEAPSWPTSASRVRSHGLDARWSPPAVRRHEECRQAQRPPEHRPGTYIYNDRMRVAAGIASWDDCALNIYATVVSRAAADRGILDAARRR